jgi:predicted transcriptional regulator
MVCPLCATELLSPEARFCTKCGAPLPRRAAGLIKAASFGRAILLPLALVGRALAWPIRKRQERIRWRTKASGPNSPINDVHGLSDEAKRVYAYLASVTLRFGSSHSRLRTIAHVAGLSEYKARKAIHELERRGLLSHRRRNTWHGRGAHEYYVRRITDH